MSLSNLLMSLMIAAVLLLGAGCSTKSDRSNERIWASEAGSYVFRSKSNSLRVPFVIDSEASAKKAILAYLEANYRDALEKGVEGLDSIKLDDSDGNPSYYVILKIDSIHIVIFAPKGGSEVWEMAIDVRLLK